MIFDEETGYVFSDNGTIIGCRGSKFKPMTATDIIKATRWKCWKCDMQLDAVDIMENQFDGSLRLKFQHHGEGLITDRIANPPIRRRSDVLVFAGELNQIKPFAPTLAEIAANGAMEAMNYALDTPGNAFQQYVQQITEDLTRQMGVNYSNSSDLEIRREFERQSRAAQRMPSWVDSAYRLNPTFICQLCRRPVENVDYERDNARRLLLLTFRCHGSEERAVVPEYEMMEKEFGALRPFQKHWEAINNQKPEPVVAPIKPAVLLLDCERKITYE